MWVVYHSLQVRVPEGNLPLPAVLGIVLGIVLEVVPEVVLGDGLGVPVAVVDFGCGAVLAVRTRTPASNLRRQQEDHTRAHLYGIEPSRVRDASLSTHKSHRG